MTIYEQRKMEKALKEIGDISYQLVIAKRNIESLTYLSNLSGEELEKIQEVADIFNKITDHLEDSIEQEITK